MPSKNRLKNYVADGFYHVYNRGVAKQKIFVDTQDYKVFLKYLKEALTKPVEKKVSFSLRGRTFQALSRSAKNFQNDISLIAFCLMPNHFHLLIRQNKKDSMVHFMRSVITRYASYFNKKYKRVGPVFQGRYKAVLVTKDEYLLHLTRYIHLNPLEHFSNLRSAYSSYPDYLGLRTTSWIKPDFILKFFNGPEMPEFRKTSDYESFVENFKADSSSVLGEITLE